MKTNYVVAFLAWPVFTFYCARGEFVICKTQ